MLSRYIKNIDVFGKNIVLVFLGSSLVNLFNLLYQLLIAHRLSAIDFSAVNTLFSLFMLVSSPLITLQLATVKYCSAFIAQNEQDKIRAFLSGLLGKVLIASIVTLVVCLLAAGGIADKLKIPQTSSVYILAVLLAASWLSPVFLGGLQGFELFNWLNSVLIVSGALKLILAFIFIGWGFAVAGAMGAFLISSLFVIAIAFLPLRNFFVFSLRPADVDFKEFFFYLFPVGISSFCFTGLVNGDMVLVKYFFSSSEASFYAVAQMTGKIFLFLPAAISIVMFPRTSNLNARNMDTSSTLRRSLFYASVLCVTASLVYNIFPVFVLKMLTGKAPAQAVFLGRLFSVSMSGFSLLFILISYFLSVKDMRFIKYLILFTVLQFAAISLFHNTLSQVQVALCINAVILFCIFLLLTRRKNPLTKGS